MVVVVVVVVPVTMAVMLMERHLSQSIAGGSVWLRAVTGRAGTVVAVAALTVVAALGRLPGMMPTPRGWGVVSDPSLVRAAETLAALRGDAALAPASRGFCYAPDVADCIATGLPVRYWSSRLKTSRGVST